MGPLYWHFLICSSSSWPMVSEYSVQQPMGNTHHHSSIKLGCQIIKDYMAATSASWLMSQYDDLTHTHKAKTGKARDPLFLHQCWTTLPSHYHRSVDAGDEVSRDCARSCLKVKRDPHKPCHIFLLLSTTVLSEPDLSHIFQLASLARLWIWWKTLENAWISESSVVFSQQSTDPAIGSSYTSQKIGNRLWPWDIT